MNRKRSPVAPSKRLRRVAKVAGHRPKPKASPQLSSLLALLDPQCQDRAATFIDKVERVRTGVPSSYLAVAHVGDGRSEKQVARLEGNDPARTGAWLCKILTSSAEVASSGPQRFRLRLWGSGGKAFGSCTIRLPRDLARTAAPVGARRPSPASTPVQQQAVTSAHPCRIPSAGADRRPSSGQPGGSRSQEATTMDEHEHGLDEDDVIDAEWDEYEGQPAPPPPDPQPDHGVSGAPAPAQPPVPAYPPPAPAPVAAPAPCPFCAGLRGELQISHQRLDQASYHHRQLSDAAEAWKQRCDELQQRCGELQERNTSLENRYAASQQRCAQLQSRNASLNQRVAELISGIDEIGSTMGWNDEDEDEDS